MYIIFLEQAFINVYFDFNNVIKKIIETMWLLELEKKAINSKDFP